jgi:hypothetical protein
MSHFLICVLPWPVFSSLSIRARLIVLNPSSAFILSVIESFAVEAQFLVFVACHLRFNCRTPPFFSKGNVIVACPLKLLFTFDLCAIHGQGAGFLRNRCAPV